MSWNLPISVEIDGTEYAIRNKCDYRVVLDVIKGYMQELERTMICYHSDIMREYTRC